MSLWETQTRRRIKSALLTLGQLSLVGLVNSCHQGEDFGFISIVSQMVKDGSIARQIVNDGCIEHNVIGWKTVYTTN